MDLNLFKRHADHAWEIAPFGAMRVPAIIYGSQALVREMDAKVYEQAVNVATGGLGSSGELAGQTRAAGRAANDFVHENTWPGPSASCRSGSVGSPYRIEAAPQPFIPLRPGPVWINFGVWDVVRSRQPQPPGFRNRKIEREVASLGGHKSLYSEAYYPEQEFWSLHDRPAYLALKRRYDPEGALGDLYAKCVLRQ